VGRLAAHRLANSTSIRPAGDGTWAVNDLWVSRDVNQPGEGGSSEPDSAGAPGLLPGASSGWCRGSGALPPLARFRPAPADRPGLSSVSPHLCQDLPAATRPS